MKNLLIFILLASVLEASAQITDTTILRNYINSNISANNARQITGLQMNTIFNGFLNIMKSYKTRGVDSLYNIDDSTLGVKNTGNTYNLRVQGGSGSGSGSPFTVVDTTIVFNGTFSSFHVNTGVSFNPVAFTFNVDKDTGNGFDWTYDSTLKRITLKYPVGPYDWVNNTPVTVNFKIIITPPAS